MYDPPQITEITGDIKQGIKKQLEKMNHGIHFEYWGREKTDPQ